MIRKTERIECKYPEYPKFLDGTYTYRYIGNNTEPNAIIGELICRLGELEDKFEKIEKIKEEKKQKRKEKRNEIHD